MHKPPFEPPLNVTKLTQAQSHHSLLSETQCHRILLVALSCARRHGLQGEEGEDQALAFLLHLLLYLQEHPQTDLPLILSTGWLARSSDNWIRSFLRGQRRRRKREVTWPFVAASSEATAIWRVLPSKDPLPQIEAIRIEFRQRIQDAIVGANLTDSQRELLAHLMDGERAVDIAAHLQRPPETIRQRLHTLRIRLGKVLQGRGLGEAEIQEYLSILGL